MKDILKDHLENALLEFTTGEHYNTLLDAKEEYFRLTGQVNEDDEDYESRMSSFNDWYILQFIPKNSDKPIIEKYALKHDLEEEVFKALTNVTHSLFEFAGNNLKKHQVIKDLLHKQKIILPLDHYRLTMLKTDIFVGRAITYEDKTYLLNGICMLPGEVKGLLKKECRKVRKMNDSDKEMKFLLKVEYLKTKWLRYGHIEPNKIFKFEEL